MKIPCLRIILGAFRELLIKAKYSFRRFEKCTSLLFCVHFEKREKCINQQILSCGDFFCSILVRKRITLFSGGQKYG